jgi:hypothetical protein
MPLMKPRVLTLSVALAVGLAVPAPAWANAPASKAAVEVDVALDQPDDAALAARLRGEVVKALNTEGIAVTKAAGPDEGLIKVRVRWNADDNHEITAEVIAAGETKTPEGGPWVCDTCREAQLSAKVAEVAGQLVPLLPETADAASGDGGGAGVTPGDGGGGETNGGGGKRKLGTLGKVGIPLLVVGVGGAVAGGVLAAMGEKRSAASDDPQDVEVTDYSKPGIPIAVVGAALAVTGIALLAVDLSRSSKKKKTAMAPMLAPGLAGIGLSGRF